MKQKQKLLKLLIFFITFTVLFFSAQKSQAAINSQINYQGKLTDAAGVAKPNGNYNMIITIYDAASGGSCVWTARGTCGTPTARSVALVNGIFSIMLGDSGDNALTGLDFNVPYYLGVTVESDPEMTPRKVIGASAYAFNSNMLNGLSSKTSGADAHIIATDSSGNATISGNTYFNGTTYYINSSGTGNLNALALNGTLGIGVASPSAYLNIKAGTATANTAPIKFTAGTNLTNAEAGAMEWDGTNLFITQTTGPTRKTLAYTTDLHSAVTLGTANGLSLATQQLSLGLASNGVNGALSGTDWATFNGKENALTFSTGLTRSVNTITNNLSTGVSGGQTLIGSTSTNSGLTIKSTTGNGVSGANIIFQTGNNGATEAMRILYDGKIGIGNASPTVALHIGTNATTNLGSTANSVMVSGGLEVAGSAYLGPMEFPTDAGAISWINMPVSASASTGTVESYTARLGGTNIMTIYGTAVGSGGGIANPRVGIGTLLPGYVLDVQHASSKINSKNGYLTNGADYAEYFYTKDADLKSGEVVCVDTSKANSVKRCQRSADVDVMGIVSTNPSVVGNGSGQERDNDPNYKVIGMMGQVPGLVSTENGSIKIGDSLTSGNTAGYMRKANAGESTVGVAMQNFDEDLGIIQVLISRRNQSLTVEKVEQTVTENIANMNIQDKVNSIVNDAAANLNAQIENLTVFQETQLSSLGTDISSLKTMQAKIQDQMDLITQQGKTISDFIVNINVDDIVYRDALGNINLPNGKIIAKDIEAVDSIKANDLKGENIELGSDVSGTGKIKGGELKSDPILTKEAKEGVKIYITPKNSTEGKTLYYDEDDIKDGESFVVKVDSPALENDVEFNWLIIK